MPIQRLVVFAHGEFALSGLDTLSGGDRSVELVVAGPRRSPEEPLDDDVPPARWARDHDVDLLKRGAAEARIEERIRDKEPDAIVTLGWDRDLPAALLEVAEHGAIGVHASLLPRFRGGDPIRAALTAGDKQTGVTTYAWEGELDAGPIYLQETVDIGDEETYGQLLPRLAQLGSELLEKTLAGIVKKGRAKLSPKAQDEKGVSQAPRVGKRHRKAPWVMGAETVFHRLRAYAPEPGLSAFFRGKYVDVLSGRPLDWVQVPDGRPGTYFGLRQGRMTILCGDRTAFGVERLRFEGGEPMGASRFVRDHELEVGDRLI